MLARLNGIYELDGLKEAFDSITNNYTMETQSFFNIAAVDRVNGIYSTTYVQKKTSLYVEDAKYIYDDNDMVNEGYVTTPESGVVSKFVLEGDTIEERLNSTLETENLISTSITKPFEDEYFTMNDLNTSYVNKYSTGSFDKTKYLGWIKISDNVYQCDVKDALLEIAKLVVPGFTNGGTYLTYNRVTVEVGEQLTIRLYVSITQSGKVIDEHNNSMEAPNWYMLFAEAKIYNVNETTLPCLDNLFGIKDETENEIEE